MEAIISTDSLTKKYRDIVAVKEVSLHVRRGEIYGFLGLNGAGKTTTIRMLLGMIQPTAGSANLFGKKVTCNTGLWNKTGYLVETPSAYPNLTVYENLAMVSRLRYLKGKEPIDEIIERLRLGTYRKKRVKHLSLGNMQRLGLAKALIHKPELLILDEPTNGLDPAGITEIREMLLDITKNHGVTVFVSSHILVEVARFASRIGIIHNGELIQELDTKEIEKRCIRSVVIRTKNLQATSEFLAGKGIQTELSENGCLITQSESAISDPASITEMLVYAGHSPSLLTTDEEDLESYFFRTIGLKGGIL